MKRNTYLLLFLILSSLALGIAGFTMAGYGLLTSIYLTLQLFVLEADVTFISKNIFLTLAFFACPLLTATAIINVILIYAKGGIIIWRISRFKNHVVICGLNRISLFLANDFLKEGYHIVIIDQQEDNPFIQELRSSKTLLIQGDPRNRLKLIHANVFKAKYVLVYSLDDIVNIEISRSIFKVIDERKNKLAFSGTHLVKVFIHIADYFNLEIIKSYIEAEIESTAIQIDYHATNVFTKAASRVIDDLSPDKYVNLRDENKKVEILIQPLNEMGYALLREAAHMYHFGGLQKIRIHIVDDNIAEKQRYVYNKIPLIDQIVDLTFHEKSEFYRSADPDKLRYITTLFLSETIDSENLVYAKRLRQIFFDISGKLEFPPIGVILHEESTIAELFDNISSEVSFLHINIYNLYSDFCSKQSVIQNQENYDRIAMQIHNQYLDEHLEKDELYKSWDALTDAQKDFNRYPARHFPIKLRYLGLDPDNAEISNETGKQLQDIEEQRWEIIGRMEHKRWVAEKLLTGFVKGKVLNDPQLQGKLKSILKYHTDIRDWEELSDTDKSKDLMALEQIQFIIDQISNKT